MHSNTGEYGMDIRQILNEYDGMFARCTPDEIAEFLRRNVKEAEASSDKPALLTLLNEQIGFCRDTGRESEAIDGCQKLRLLLDEMELAGTIHYGKSLLNIANAYRAFARYDEAEELFGEIERLYVTILPEGSYDYAALYNNWSLLAMDTGRTEKACDLIRLALDVIDRYDKAVIEQATSRVNLACALMAQATGGEDNDAVTAAADSDSWTQNMQGKRSNCLNEAGKLLDEAVSRFEAAGGDDFHYSSALAAVGDLRMKQGKFEDAVDQYRRARELTARYTGEGRRTKILDDKISTALSRI